jgi:hypothetical protein
VQTTKRDGISDQISSAISGSEEAQLDQGIASLWQEEPRAKKAMPKNVTDQRYLAERHRLPPIVTDV